MVFAFAGDSTTTSFKFDAFLYVRTRDGGDRDFVASRDGILMAEPSYDVCLVEAELKARAGYAQPSRHYHDVRHLEECLRELANVHDLSERDRRLLRWAILWHDAV